MSLSELRETLQRLDLKPSRKLGQNFLHDQNILQRIAAESEFAVSDHAIEIGPGTGNLTALLLETGADLTAIEYDVRLAEFLHERFADAENFTLIQADAARVDFTELAQNKAWKCCANLPYSVSTVILARLLAIPNPPEVMTLLLQREMAERIVAGPGSKTFGTMSVRVQAIYDSKLVKVVSPNVFLPRPDVDSAILKLRLKAIRPSPEEFRAISEVVGVCFQKRRKKLSNCLKRYVNADEIAEQLGIDLTKRPEQLAVSDFVALGKALGGV